MCLLKLNEYLKKLMEGSWDTDREQDYKVKNEYVSFLVAYLWYPYSTNLNTQHLSR